jgi:ferredoxin
MTLIPRIDEHACLGHGDCAAIAPEAFAVADVAVIVGTTTDDRLRACARACPAGAVMLFDADSGEEVDP